VQGVDANSSVAPRTQRRRLRTGVVEVLRLRRSPLPSAYGASFWLALTISALVPAGGAIAQTDDPDAQLLRPVPDGDPDNPQRFRRVDPTVPSGAGATGFISTNSPAHKKKASKAWASLPVPTAPDQARTNLQPNAVGKGRLDLTARAAVSSAVYTTPVTSETILLAPLVPAPHRVLPLLPEDPFAPTGIGVGSFLFRPALELTGGYDSNVPRSTSPTPSWYSVVAPEFLVNSIWARHEFTAALRGGYTTYASTPEFDRPNFDGRVGGRIDVTGTTHVKLETRFLVGTDNPGSPNIQANLSRLPIYTTIGGTAGVIQQFNRLEVTAKGDVDRTVYQNSHFTDGETQSNQDRNYIRYAGALRAAYEVTPGMKSFAELGGDERIYDLPVDASGVNRNSEGLAVRAGTTFEYSRMLTGEMSLGYLMRHYQDPSLVSFNGFLLDGALLWTASPLTVVKFVATTTVAESTVAGVSGVFTREVSAQVDHAFRRWLVASGKFLVGFDNYEGITRLDKRYVASALITYKLTRELWARGEYRHEWRTSNVPGNGYVADVVLFGLRVQR
jgi:hypothetical protein